MTNNTWDDFIGIGFVLLFLCFIIFIAYKTITYKPSPEEQARQEAYKTWCEENNGFYSFDLSASCQFPK